MNACMHACTWLRYVWSTRNLRDAHFYLLATDAASLIAACRVAVRADAGFTAIHINTASGRGSDTEHDAATSSSAGSEAFGHFRHVATIAAERGREDAASFCTNEDKPARSAATST